MVSGVSGQTSYLVAGHQLEDGRETCTSGKYKKAVQLKIKILTEDDFEALVQRLSGLKGFQLGTREKII